MLRQFVVIFLGLICSYAIANESAVQVQSGTYDEDRAELLERLQPPKRKRPIVTIIGANDGAETTDYLIPYGVLKRSDAADVYALGTEPGPVKLIPALTIQPDMSSQQFDEEIPEGADYVIVPAMHSSDDPMTIAWIQHQARKGALIIGICAGAKLLGHAGLLENRRATTHWFDLSSIQRANPSMEYVRDKRYVVDGNVVTTTGVTASIPLSLTLVEAIAGYARTVQLANELGVQSWDDNHNSSAFQGTRRSYITAAMNTLAFWNHETLKLQLNKGVDDIALALTADAWSRTYRSKVLTRSNTAEPLVTQSGIVVLPDTAGAATESDKDLPAVPSQFPARTLDVVLGQIADRYTQRTADFVALQLEYAVEGIKP